MTWKKWKLLITSAVLVVCVTLWLQGLLNSPVVNPDMRREHQFLNRYLQDHAPDLQTERDLAHDYWHRYPDVRTDPYFGEKGPAGIFGAREHYRLHGKSEGRIFAPIIIPEDMEREKQRAEDYWRRYPDIEKSAVWGRKGTLGILGPRDHYFYRGRHSGRIWSTDD